MTSTARFMVLLVLYTEWSQTAWAHEPNEFTQLKLDLVVSEPADATQPHLLVHFHGDPAVTQQNFRRSRLSGVLLTVNCRGLSSAYRKPFENERLFAYLLEHAKQKCVTAGALPRGAEWQQIRLSSFSAGYGAVREILKSPAYVSSIDSVLAADSIYASIHLVEQERFVDEKQMRPFLNFAKQAIRGEKRFLISHSQLAVEPYASTVETSDYLLLKTGIPRKPLVVVRSQEFTPISKGQRGLFTVLGYQGVTGEDHLQHLRRISDLWIQLHPAE